MSEPGISIRELFVQVYDRLREKLSGRDVALPEEARAQIADDSDWHRTRVGYMGYKTALVAKVGTQTWAIVRGEACGGYPADPYDGDLAAVKLPEDIQETNLGQKISEFMKAATYFHNSLVIGMADGQMAMHPNSQFHSLMIKQLRTLPNDSVARELEVEHGVYLLDLRPVVKATVLYKPHLVAHLADALAAVLTAATA